MHGNDPFNSPTAYVDSIAGISWTSPVNGLATISGGLWELSRSLNRTENWRFLVNGVQVTGGLLGPTDLFTSAAPMPYSEGSGGAGALTRLVSVGDILSLEIFRTGSEPATFVGVDLAVTVSNPNAVPEPNGLALFGIGALGILGYRRRQRKRL